MKILHVITSIKKAAGTSTFCGEVCNQLAALGHDVTIAVCDPKQQNLYPLDPRVHLVSIDFILHSSTSTRNFDLIHIHGLWTPILHRVSNLACAHKVPVVWSTHGMTAPWAMKHKWWKKWLPWHLYQKRDLRRARIIHCTSDFEVAWNWKLGFGRTFLAPLGTFLPGIKKEGRESRLTADGSSSHSKIRTFEHSNIRTFLFVGRIYPVKALDRLIGAFGKACRVEVEKCRDWVLRIVGPDQAGHMIELMALCNRLGLSYSFQNGQRVVVKSDREDDKIISPTPTQNSNFIRPQVEFVGPKYGVDLDDEYANCTALALVSHTENFGATVVDALAHSKPVVTSTKTPWKTVSARQCGWWVDNDIESLSSALVQLFGCSPSELREMGRRGRELVEEKHTWKAVVGAMIHGYEQVLNTCEFAPFDSCRNYGDTCPIK